MILKILAKSAQKIIFTNHRQEEWNIGKQRGAKILFDPIKKALDY